MPSRPSLFGQNPQNTRCNIFLEAIESVLKEWFEWHPQPPGCLLQSDSTRSLPENSRATGSSLQLPCKPPWKRADSSSFGSTFGFKVLQGKEKIGFRVSPCRVCPGQSVSLPEYPLGISLNSLIMLG